MSKKYRFVFHGTTEEFAEKVNQNFNNKDNNEPFRDDDFSVDIRFGYYAFRLKRGGHSGSYWFVPNITEENGDLIIKGRIEYIAYPQSESRLKRFFAKADEFIFCVLLSPIILIVKLYQLIRNLIYKILRKPISREETEKDRLFYLMENILDCTRM